MPSGNIKLKKKIIACVGYLLKEKPRKSLWFFNLVMCGIMEMFGTSVDARP